MGVTEYRNTINLPYFSIGNIYVKAGVIGFIFMVNGWGVVLNNRYTTYKYTYICVRVNNTHLCAES